MNKLSILAVGLLAFALVPPASATMAGSLGWSTPILTEADASPTGDINTSDLFTLEQLVSTNNTSGIFAGLPIQDFGTIIMDTTVGTGLNVGSAVFGTFNSSKITTVSNVPGFLNLLIDGDWHPGTFNNKLHGSFPAEVRISFTQSPVTTGEISFGGTMATTIAIVPEPGTSLLFLTGIGLVLAGSRLRRLWA